LFGMAEPLRVGLLLFPKVTQLDMTAPYEVFSRLEDAEVHLVSEDTAPIASEWGMAITPTTRRAEAPQFDVVCVPGGVGINPLLEHAPTLEFLAHQAQKARYMTSVCTGALVLGAAGLLRGYRATTHWRFVSLLPLLGAIPVDARVVIDRGRVTGGGVTAGIDFALTLAAELRGERAARALQLVLEYDPAPPFTSGSPRAGAAAPDLVTEVAQRYAAGFEVRKRLVEGAAGKLGLGGKCGTPLD
jgi:cyclohexyl-isocyanide hydratase